MEAAAVIATVLLVVVIGFQLALAAGAPWGKAAYGGGWEGVLPTGIRINSAVFGLAIYPLVVGYILDIGGVVTADWLPGSRTFVIWALVVFFALGAVMNAVSRSRIERTIWTPIVGALFICCLVLALA